MFQIYINMWVGEWIWVNFVFYCKCVCVCAHSDFELLSRSKLWISDSFSVSLTVVDDLIDRTLLFWMTENDIMTLQLIEKCWVYMACALCMKVEITSCYYYLTAVMTKHLFVVSNLIENYEKKINCWMLCLFSIINNESVDFNMHVHDFLLWNVFVKIIF